MKFMEVALLILGVAAFVASFVIPEKKNDSEGQSLDPEVIRKLFDKEVQEAKQRVSEVIDETLNYAVEKTERASERISNEKIMAISDYSETVLSDVNKAHQEVMFLYDMLNDKHKNIKETAKKVDQQAKEAESKVNVLIERQKESNQKLLNQKTANQIAVSRIMPEQIQKPQEPKKMLQEIAVDNPAEIKTQPQRIEVYSFAKEAPRVERSIPREPVKEAQAARLENTVTMMKKQEEQTAVPENKPVKENNNDRILRLYKSGLSSVDIAKELGLGVGEVKLVINLFKGAV